MHIITATNGLTSPGEVLATTTDLAEALTYVEDNLNPVLVEIDSDYPACADGFLADGRIITIQPEGFTLAA